MYIDGNLNEAQLCSLSGKEETDFSLTKRKLSNRKKSASFLHLLLTLFFHFRQVIFYTLLQRLSLLCDLLEINNNNV